MTKTKYRLIWVVFLAAVLLASGCFGSFIGTKYVLTVVVSGEGTAGPEDGKYVREKNELVQLLAEPAPGWQFVKWHGDVVDPLDPNTTIVMTSRKAVMAEFEEIPPPIYLLTVAVNGQGEVVPAPGEHAYEADSVVPLTAAAEDGWEFIQWQGEAADPASPETTITMDGDKAVTAVFSEIQPLEFTLTMAKEGEGVVQPSVGNHIMAADAVVTVTAQPAPGWRFEYWLGATADFAAPETTVVMDESKTVTAVFAEIQPVIYSLTVNREGEGDVVPEEGTHMYEENTVVNLSAIPEASWDFAYWQGSVHDPDSAETFIVMDGDQEITAVFEPGTPGEYYLITAVQGSGSVIPAPGTHTYTAGTVVDLAAQPASGWSFDYWLGNATSSSSPETQVLMDEDKQATAVFAQNFHSLTVQKAGSGTVTPSPGTYEYSEGSVVALSARPASGWQFREWEGPVAAVHSQDTSVTISTDTVVKAVFDPIYYSLTMAAQGSGSTTPPAGSHSYQAGSVVAVQADAADGWQFLRWDGPAASPHSASTQVTVLENVTLTAVFAEVSDDMVLLTVEKEGQGTVSPVPGRHQYDPGTTVGLTAAAAPQWRFVGWAGPVDDPENASTSVYLAEDTTVRAIFEAITYTLTMGQNGAGTTIPAGGQHQYPAGEVVAIQASPALGWRFLRWDGPVADPTNPATTVKMDADKSVEAVFEFVTDKGSLGGNINVQHAFPDSPVTSAAAHSFPERADIETRPMWDWRAAPEAVPGEMIVEFVPGLSRDEKLGVLQQQGVTALQWLDVLDMALVHVPADDVTASSAVLRIDPRVRSAVPNNRVYPTGTTVTPNDPHFSQQWHYRQIRLPQAWPNTTGSPSVRIAVLDTGIQPDHPDLMGNLDWGSGYNFIDNNNQPTDHNGHGTHVAGTIGAVTNNAVGVAGVMWNVTIVPVKVLGASGGSDFQVAAGILYAAGLHDELENPNPVQVINMSLGARNSLSATRQAAAAASAAGVLLVAAAGNNDSDRLSYPAAYSDVIAVGAVGYGGSAAPSRAYYSNYGTGLELVAPGGENPNYVISTYTNSSYAGGSGTSMAAPHVSGVIGLMLARGMSAADIRSTLIRTAMDLGTTGWDRFYGHGLVNAYWAVNDVQAIRVMLGHWSGDTFTPAYETAGGLTGGSFDFPEVTAGTYTLLAVIDVEGNSWINPGDYYAEVGSITVLPDAAVTRNLMLNEQTAARGQISPSQ